MKLVEAVSALNAVVKTINLVFKHLFYEKHVMLCGQQKTFPTYWKLHIERTKNELAEDTDITLLSMTTQNN